ncbi:RN122 protein, partial [Polypterus senegalus]
MISFLVLEGINFFTLVKLKITQSCCVFAGCVCGLAYQHSDKSSKMTSPGIYDLPLNIYVIILGIGLFIFMLSMIFCCYLFRLRRQNQRDQYGYNEVVLKGAGKKLSLLGQMCAVCLEEFKAKEELGVCPCSHAFHKKCLVKWLEIRSVCPMCNKPICRLTEARQEEVPQNQQEV